MRRALAALTLLALPLASALPAQAAMQAEPKDFLGIPFAKPYEPDRTFSCQRDSEEGLNCARATDQLVLLGVPLKNLRYVFMQGYLYTVDAEVAGRENHDRLVAELTARHGKPETLQGGMLSWSGTNVDILLHYDASRKTGEVDYIYKNIPCGLE
ncbi:hypothetical protein NNJEOMEG_01113 [Fundidesulfovibrio magnetotacticus]|uniref:Uncharacterized protein n=1 Tax=Fundidesulfovibrio magnetotacticus TaxID=2730080 RepID=A0A6V8LKQ9_9BACT|nr:hypothetical protein [Fundidesulfovibrio magnetotacticus]GFK93282.1 hypothetical protein NNJEOMEG_01113 [Fundidesulfovibrio magnetotacticus]